MHLQLQRPLELRLSLPYFYKYLVAAAGAGWIARTNLFAMEANNTKERASNHPNNCSLQQPLVDHGLTTTLDKSINTTALINLTIIPCHAKRKV